MKSKILFLFLQFFLFIIYNSLLHSQTWNIQCTRKPLTSINFISPSKAWIFGGHRFSGGNLLYKSTNNGDNWNAPIIQNLLIGGDNGASFNSLCFVDSLYGWACQNNTTILKTINGGDQWNSLSVGISFYRINTIYFINRNTGWIGGQNINYHNLIAKTTNGGSTWNLMYSNLNFEPGQIYMLNENKGYSIPTYGEIAWDSVATTINGGSNWSYFRAGDSTGQPVTKILFLDSLNGWLLGFNNYVSKTTNGGISWAFYRNNIANPEDMFFLNNLTGWTAGIRNEVWKTTNGGINWLKKMGSLSYYGYLLSIFFKNQNTGWVTSDDGTIFKSTDGGINWYNYVDPPHGLIDDIFFTNSYTGWTVSNNSDSGYISKSISGGNDWSTLAIFGSTLNSIHFINSNIGFVVGSGGRILKTTNGGINWNMQTPSSNSFYSITFKDSSNGWICGSNGQILRTTNTGFNWENQINGNSYNLNAVQFLDLSTGYCVGDSGKVLRTTNGGINWIITQPLGNHSYSDLFFINSTTGWVIGNKYTSGGMYWGTEKVIIKTTNDGNNWITLYSSSALYQGTSLKSIHFIDSQTGWVASVFNGILKTTNSGENWFSNSPSISDGFNSIFFINNETGWVAGGYNSVGCGGTVLTCGNFPIGINNINSTVPIKTTLYQNYPNPFNPITKIKYELLANTHVRIIMYDILGKEIETLINENKKAGSYVIDWNGSQYPSGVYFYEIITNGYYETKKMVLIK